MAPTGEAVAKDGDRWIFVDNGIPGERLRVSVDAQQENETHIRATAIEVLKASNDRVVPMCRHASECGGCAWQHIAYPAQLNLKRDLVRRLLSEALPKHSVDVRSTIGVTHEENEPPRAFRQKISFAFTSDERGHLALAHFARRSHTLIPVQECPVHSERGNAISARMCEALDRAGIRSADERDGLARHVVVRTSGDDAEAAAVLVTTRADARLERPIHAVTSRGGTARPEGLMVNIHDRPGPYLLGGETIRVAGPGHVRETTLGPQYLVSPTSFFQTSIEGARTLLRLVTDALPNEPRLRVLELFSGAGLFSIPLALAGHTVTAVEESRKASREAALNAKLNEVPRARLRLLPGKAEDVVGHLVRDRFDAVLLDPPRQGCPPDVLDLVCRRLRPETLVIVSCNPEALAQELELSVEAGYLMDFVQPVDMFPHTPHIEAVAVLHAGRRRTHSTHLRRQ